MSFSNLESNKKIEYNTVHLLETSIFSFVNSELYRKYLKSPDPNRSIEYVS